MTLSAGSDPIFVIFLSFLFFTFGFRVSVFGVFFERGILGNAAISLIEGEVIDCIKVDTGI